MLNFSMLDFTKKLFRKYFEILLWLNLALCTGAAGYYFYSTIARDVYINSVGVIAWNTNVFLVILGVLIGFLIGLVSNLLIGGFVATFINIDKTLEEIKNK